MAASSCCPNEVCAAHLSESRDSDGHMVFYVSETPGQFVSYHIVNGVIEERNDSTCYVRGRKCLVTAQHFGGLVVELA